MWSKRWGLPQRRCPTLMGVALQHIAGGLALPLHRSHRKSHPDHSSNLYIIKQRRPTWRLWEAANLLPSIITTFFCFCFPVAKRHNLVYNGICFRVKTGPNHEGGLHPSGLFSGAAEWIVITVLSVQAEPDNVTARATDYVLWASDSGKIAASCTDTCLGKTGTESYWGLYVFCLLQKTKSTVIQNKIKFDQKKRKWKAQKVGRWKPAACAMQWLCCGPLDVWLLCP